MLDSPSWNPTPGTKLWAKIIGSPLVRAEAIGEAKRISTNTRARPFSGNSGTRTPRISTQAR